MGMVKWLIEKERRFAWSLLGTVVGMVSLYFAYLALRERKPELTFSVISEANVLDVHKTLPSLEIRFQGEDIQQHALNLKVITVQLTNTGDVPILQTQYDQAGVWGFAVSGGRIVEVRLTRANDSYLRSRLQPTLGIDSVFLQKPIFEKGSYAVLEVLVLHARQSRPGIKPFGKIAGIAQFKVDVLPNGTLELPLWRQVLDGPALVQALRVPIYTLGLLIILGAIVLFSIGVSDVAESRSKTRRRSHVAEYRRSSKQPATVRAFFADLYIDHGADWLVLAQKLLSNERLLRREILRARSLSRRDAAAITASIRFDEPVSMQHETFPRSRLSIIAMRLYLAHIVRVDAERMVTISEGVHDALAELLLTVPDSQDSADRLRATFLETGA